MSSSDSPWPAQELTGSAAPDRPRPAAIVGALLTLTGAIIVGVGASLTWFSLGETDFDGFSEIDPTTSDASLGVTFVTLAVIVAGLAVTTLAARRILPIAIVAVVLTAFLTVAGVGKYTDLRDDVRQFEGFGAVGLGLPVIILGAVVALVGSILVLARRRR